jgi:hypothetical protein
LQGAPQHYEFRRLFATEQTADHPESTPSPDEWWNPAWLPILPIDGGVVLAVDLALGDGTVAPCVRSIGNRSDRRWVTRVLADPYLRVDTNDYSLHPGLVGRRIEVRVSQTALLAACLDSGELACRHPRSFARHRTITALEHARALRQRRGDPPEPVVETRSLARYDELIA